MAEITQCPGCRRRLETPESAFGKTVQCPQCRTTFVAGRTEPAPAPARRVPEPAVRPPEPRDEPPRHDEPYDDPVPRRRSVVLDRFGDDDDWGGRRRFAVPHRGGSVLAIGVLSLFICGVGVILGPIAWAMGSSDLGEIRAGRMDRAGESLTQAGMICGIFGTIIHALVVLFALVAGAVG